MTISIQQIPDDAEIILHRLEMDRALMGDHRAWFDPDAGKETDNLDLLPPNLCGFWRLK